MSSFKNTPSKRVKKQQVLDPEALISGPNSIRATASSSGTSSHSAVGCKTTTAIAHMLQRRARKTLRQHLRKRYTPVLILHLLCLSQQRQGRTHRQKKWRQNSTTQPKHQTSTMLQAKPTGSLSRGDSSKFG